MDQFKPHTRSNIPWHRRNGRTNLHPAWNFFDIARTVGMICLGINLLGTRSEICKPEEKAKRARG
ncbi:hypothetical protein RSAG8_07358, partial [Rhizoctonia solani AG-8 WAC10335]